MRKKQWPEVKLGDYVDLLSGFAFKSKNFTDNPDDIPLVKGANVHQGYIDWEGAVRWPKEEFESYDKFQLQDNDVVLAMDRPWIEAGLKYSWIKKGDPKSLLVQRVSRLRGVNGLDTRYLRYVIGSPQFTGYIKPIVTGVNVPHISGAQIKDYKFLLPPERYQNNVADILETYDNLIENNNRRIAILEEMAQSLYREWFVKFRFPGHENIKLIDSPLGMIPEGWEVKLLNEVSENFDRMRKPLSKMQREKRKGKFPYYGAAKIFDYIDDYIFDGQYLLMAEDGSVVTPNRNPVLQMAYGKFWANNHTHILRGAGLITTDHLYLALKTIDVMPYITGAAQPKITQTNMNRIQILVPDELLISKFNEYVGSVFIEIKTLIQKLGNLKKQRDLLIPKLISEAVLVESHEGEAA
ncbi:MAG: restriction endonuclease subunit S [Sedimenticola sp.]